MKIYFYICVVIILFSCKQTKDKIMTREDQFVQDSLKVLQLFKENKIYPSSKINSYENTLWYGNIFNNNHNYLIINRDKEKTYYVYKNNELKNILNYSLGAQFISDTIYHANNDSYLDVLIQHSEQASIINAYYLQNKEATLNDTIRLSNLKQNGKQLLVFLRSNSPIIKFYKFEWNGTHLDTIEWIAYDNSLPNQKQYFRSKKMDIFKTNTDAEYFVGLEKGDYTLLDELPAAYKKIDSLYYE